MTGELLLEHGCLALIKDLQGSLFEEHFRLRRLIIGDRLKLVLIFVLEHLKVAR